MTYKRLVVASIAFVLTFCTVIGYSGAKDQFDNSLQGPDRSLKDLAGSYFNQYTLLQVTNAQGENPQSTSVPSLAPRAVEGQADADSRKPPVLESIPALLPVLPYDDRAVVLMYHHIDPSPSGQSTITPALFKEQMEYLLREGYRVVPLRQLCDYIDGDGTIPSKAVAITFDDGYKSFYKYAFPILKEFNFHATNFIIVANTDVKLPPGHLEHLSWDEMLEMQKSGLVGFGSHTYDQHYYAPVNGSGALKPALTARIYDRETGMTESQEGYERRVLADLSSSKRIMEEHLGVEVDTLAFPYGASTPEVIRLARIAGFKYMFGVSQGMVRTGDDKARLKRLNGGNPKITVPMLAASLGNIVIESMIKVPSVRYYSAKLQTSKSSR